MLAFARYRRETMTEPRPLDCRSAMMQLYDYLDGELTPERMALIRTHLDDCGPCFAHAQFERDLLAIISGGWKDVGASQALLRKIQDDLRGEGFRSV
jgi:mycothiol system anti-sigma-R factor